MTDDPRPNPRKLEAFIQGETSTDESRRLVAWAQSQPEWNAASMWHKIAAAIDEDQARPRLHAAAARRNRLAKPRRMWATALAAAIVFAVVGGVWVYVDSIPEETAQLVVRTHLTERGQRASVQLPDGSAIQLGPLSSLRIDEGFGSSHRAVTLDGDGYFHVIHDASRPFIVRTPRGEVRDLGTRFVVRARGREARVDVAVAEGTVAIGKTSVPPSMEVAALDGDSVVLNAGEIATMDANGQSAPVVVRNIDRYFAWTRGPLVFDREPLDDVLTELNRWFAEDVVLGDPTLGQIRLTTVLRGETLDEALLVLETSLDMDVRRTSGKVVLRRRGAAVDTTARR
jgi:transmembrane sensor